MLELVLHSLDVHLESADVRVGVVACASAHGTAREARREERRRDPCVSVPHFTGRREVRGKGERWESGPTRRDDTSFSLETLVSLHKYYRHK